MMKKQMVLTAAALLAAVPATAQTLSSENPFEILPVSDYALADTRGTAAPQSRFTRSSFRVTTDRLARDDALFTGAIASTQMDVWWGTIGSQLIATAVRAGP